MLPSGCSLSMPGESGAWVTSWPLRSAYRDVKTSGLGVPVGAQEPQTQVLLSSDPVPGLAAPCSLVLPAQLLVEAVPPMHASHLRQQLPSQKARPVTGSSNYLGAPALVPLAIIRHQPLNAAACPSLRRASGVHDAVPDYHRGGGCCWLHNSQT